jgi:predicted AAA+ superfamily ATPase
VPRNKDTDSDRDLTRLLGRIAAALDRLAPARTEPAPLDRAEAFVWRAEDQVLDPVAKINRLALDLLKGIEPQARTLLENTRRFAEGLPANNALLWGARGMGKSSLVKAIHGKVNEERAERDQPLLVLAEIHREDIPTLPRLLQRLRDETRRCILFCDDLSFDTEDTSYKSLKAVLEGGVEGRPDNVIFYATSNRRHLMPRDMIDNERATAIHGGEAIEEKVSLSDRFGLWLGFHACDQDTFFAMLDGYAAAFGLKIDRAQLHREAIEWSVSRGARSGRVAWQFIQDVAGRLGKRLG